MEYLENETKKSVSSDRIYELLRLGAEEALVLISKEEVIARMEHAGMVGIGDTSEQDDPVLMAATRRAIRSSLIHWLNSTIENPSRRVDPFVSENILLNAISLQELGIPELMLTLDRAAQNIAWEYWMEVAFGISDNPEELRLLLDVSFKSISTFVDDNRQLLQEMLKEHSEQNPSRYASRKRELVLKIVDSNPRQLERSVRQLRYPMDVVHCAAIVWCESGNSTALTALESAAAFFIEVCGKNNALSVIMSGDIIWVWTTQSAPIDEGVLKRYLQKLDGVRITYANAGRGVEGFRKSHMDALSTQRVLGRLRSNASVVGYESIRLVQLLSRDPEGTNRFISNTLGNLREASVDLKTSLGTYIECGCNANKAAEVLYSHRNTLMRRLARAEELLPRPLSKNLVHVAAALEMDRWLSV